MTSNENHPKWSFSTLWNELKFDVIEMLSRRDLYRAVAGTSLYILRYMSPYNIELFSRNLALETPDLKKSLNEAVTSRQLTPQPARRDKWQKQNADPINLYRRQSMDLEFNIQGCGLYKSWSGLKMLHFGTSVSVVYWGSLWIKF